MTDQLDLKLRSLVIFRRLSGDPVIRAFRTLSDALAGGEPGQCVDAYAAFCAELFAHTDNFTEYVINAALDDENIYLMKRARGETPGRRLEQSLESELSILQELGRVTSSEIKERIGYRGCLPGWENAAADFLKTYRERMAEIGTRGYGIFAKYHIFTIKAGAFVPVKHPDETRLSYLSGYEYERGCVVKNTQALLAGKPAANVLLYGDSGTGKSSTVKAVANEFAAQGLRLIELKKNQLREIPSLIDSLGKNPLKFILFIDDLSFTKDDDDFGALKAILEGSVSARTNNLAVYATSNRRHLVRETFSDREGDEVHANDTVQQLTSLSDRFGLTITFSRPNRAQYLEIVSHLAKLCDVSIPEDELFRQAEIYALERGGRSPRVAKQFLEQIQSIGL